MDLRPDVAACERNQIDWFHAEARSTGGDVWSDGPLRWIEPVPGGDLMLLFAEALPSDALDRGLARADAASVRSIGAWIRADLDAGPLAERGFERGWAPRWMTARVRDVPAPADPRVALETVGERLYVRHGFGPVGDGITWWRHH